MTTTTLDQRINLMASMTRIDLRASLYNDGNYTCEIPLHISDDFVLIGDTLHNRSDVNIENGPANIFGKPSMVVFANGWRVIAA